MLIYFLLSASVESAISGGLISSIPPHLNERVYASVPHFPIIKK